MPSLNTANCYAEPYKIPVNTTLVVPTDWQAQLADIMYKHNPNHADLIGMSLDVDGLDYKHFRVTSSNLKQYYRQRINFHTIGRGTLGLEEKKAEIMFLLKTVFLCLNNKETSENQKKAILDILTQFETIQFCTGGFHSRLVQIAAGLNFPKSLKELISYIRRDLVEPLVNTTLFGLNKTLPGWREGFEVHYKAHLYKAISSFGIDYIDDEIGGNIPQTVIDELRTNTQNLLAEKYTFFNLYAEILERLKHGLAEKGYEEKKEMPPTDENEKKQKQYFDFLKQFLPGLEQEKLYITRLEEIYDEEYKFVLGINWTHVSQGLFKGLSDLNYFNFTAKELEAKNFILSFLGNPEKQIDQTEVPDGLVELFKSPDEFVRVLGCVADGSVQNISILLKHYYTQIIKKKGIGKHDLDLLIELMRALPVSDRYKFFAETIGQEKIEIGLSGKNISSLLGLFSNDDQVRFLSQIPLDKLKNYLDKDNITRIVSCFKDLPVEQEKLLDQLYQKIITVHEGVVNAQQNEKFIDGLFEVLHPENKWRFVSKLLGNALDTENIETWLKLINITLPSQLYSPANILEIINKVDSSKRVEFLEKNLKFVRTYNFCTLLGLIKEQDIDGFINKHKNKISSTNLLLILKVLPKEKAESLVKECLYCIDSSNFVGVAEFLSEELKLIIFNRVFSSNLRNITERNIVQILELLPSDKRPDLILQLKDFHQKNNFNVALNYILTKRSSMISSDIELSAKIDAILRQDGGMGIEDLLLGKKKHVVNPNPNPNPNPIQPINTPKNELEKITADNILEKLKQTPKDKRHDLILQLKALHTSAAKSTELYYILNCRGAMFNSEKELSKKIDAILRQDGGMGIEDLLLGKKKPVANLNPVNPINPAQPINTANNTKIISVKAIKIGVYTGLTVSAIIGGTIAVCFISPVVAPIILSAKLAAGSFIANHAVTAAAASLLTQIGSLLSAVYNATHLGAIITPVLSLISTLISSFASLLVNIVSLGAPSASVVVANTCGLMTFSGIASYFVASRLSDLIVDSDDDLKYKP